MDQEQVNLHYAMLEYLYDKGVLSSSCYRYVWDEFKVENIDHDFDAGKK